MNRREFLQGGMGTIALWPLLGHTPFPQWKVYRRLHLFIVVNREDEIACDLGRAIAHTLAEELPESRAMVTRARDGFRLASLISTKQLDVALLRRSEFAAWQQNASPYDQLEPTDLKQLFAVGDYVLISRDDFLEDHATLLQQALQTHGGEEPLSEYL
ncbi:hypothetical protein C7271_18110 [filamentous cyanobacterium CCP5]|nr:hypothetical protein C7271_18110 [filamentous cyanobacterium CCP5]